MNKLLLTVLGIASLSLMFSCGNGENDSSKAETQDETVIEQDDPKEAKSKETQTEPLDADSVKEGDQIEGLTVVSADHTTGRLFVVHFDGEITLKGNLQQNPMEYTNEFFPESSPVQVKAGTETYDLFQAFNIENIKDLKAELSDEQKTMLKDGQVVTITITIANPVSSLYFKSEKRRADGTCQFVKMQ